MEVSFKFFCLAMVICYVQGIPQTLKGAQGEIFDGLNFHEFYTIKSLREGDFVFKIKIIIKIFMRSFVIWGLRMRTRMLSLILRSAVPSKHAEHTHQ